MPIYSYEHPETGEVFDELRPISKMDDPYIAPDGKECNRVEIPSAMGYCGLHEKERQAVQDGHRAFQD